MNTGKRCPKPAGFGTDHVGIGACRQHGGMLPNHQKSAWPAELALLVDEPVDVDPNQALLWCVTLTAQEIRWLDGQIAEAAASGVRAYGRPTTRVEKEVAVPLGGHMGSELTATEVKTFHPKQVHILLRDRRDAIDRLARFSKMAVDAGIAERVVKVAERMADLVAPLLEGIFGDERLKLTAAQRKQLPAVTRDHLQVLEGGGS